MQLLSPVKPFHKALCELFLGKSDSCMRSVAIESAEVGNFCEQCALRSAEATVDWNI